MRNPVLQLHSRRKQGLCFYLKRNLHSLWCSHLLHCLLWCFLTSACAMPRVLISCMLNTSSPHLSCNLGQLIELLGWWSGGSHILPCQAAVGWVPQWWGPGVGLGHEWPTMGILTSAQFGFQNPFQQQGWGGGLQEVLWAQGVHLCWNVAQVPPTLTLTSTSTSDQGAKSSSGKTQQPLKTEESA